ncbi:MAG: DUF4476 domain-containing protein [Parafilimonas sp.]
MKYPVRIITLLFFFSITFLKLNAQQKHFIYIQSEDKQPFAIVLDGKVYSSSDYGYVIVPRLTDGSYNFTVNFPMNKYPEQAFKCVINKKDLGYKLQNIPDKGWALQNMQTQKVIMSGAGDNDVAGNNAFSDMLSEVVSDSNLTKKDIVFAKPATDSVTAPAISDTVVSKNSVGFITDSIAQLQKISESKLDTGTNMVFVDKTVNGADTINVFVPTNDSVNDISSANVATDSLHDQQQTELVNSPGNNDMIKTDTVVVYHNEIFTALPDTNHISANNPFYTPADTNVQTNVNANNNNNTISNNQLVVTPQATNAVKEDCRSMLSDNDLDKIKRKMFIQDNNNEMIQTAVKYLNNKCLTTDQVKTLGNLFSSDDGRYNLYDALYNNVYDYGNYSLLKSQILDPYYKKRFEVMLR